MKIRQVDADLFYAGRRTATLKS